MRYRVTYSVLGLLLLVFAVALIVGLVVNTGRLQEAEQELQVLRQETGHLTIEDRTKFHAVTVPTEEPNTWRWRIFLPKGHRYSWQIASKEIPQNTVPKGGHGSYSNGHDWENESVVLVTATLRKTDDGDWRLSITPRIGDGRNTFVGAAVTIPKEDLAWMFEVPCTDGQVLAQREMVVRDPAGPFIFLQRRPCEKQPDGNYVPSPNPMPGFMIWLQKW
jgi:hypothetical protein